MKPWIDVEADPQFQALSPVEQSKAQAQYFDENVAPQLPGEQRDLARSQFFTEFGRSYLPEDSGQGPVASAASTAVQSLAKVGTGTAEGLGQLSQTLVRNANPVGWAAKLGVPGAQEVVDFYSQPGAMLESAGASAQEAVEEAVPSNPLLEDTMLQKGAGVAGQVTGQLASLLAGAAVTRAPKILQAIGLGEAGLMGLESGYEEANRLGITDPWERDVLAASYSAAEVIPERFFGFGTPGFTRAMIGEVQEAMGKGVVKRALKTALGEGVEEPITGTMQAAASNMLAEQDPTRPGYTPNGERIQSIDPTTGEFWSSRAEELILGAFGGSIFAGAEAIASRPNLERAKQAQQRAKMTLEVMAEKPVLTDEEVNDLAELEKQEAELQIFIQQQEAKQPVITAIDNAATSASNAGLTQSAAALERYKMATAATAAPEVPVVQEQPAEDLAATKEEHLVAPSAEIAVEDPFVADPASATQEAIQEVLPTEEAVVPATPQNAPQAISDPQRALVDTARSVVESQKGVIPSAADAWVGSKQEMLGDQSVRQAFIQNEIARDPTTTPEQAIAVFDEYIAQPNVEGLTFGGRTYLLSDGVKVSKRDGTFEEAVKRVLRHEDTHITIDAITQSNPKLKAEWEGLKKRVAADKLDDLVRRRYPKYSNWRTDSTSLELIVHEYFAEQMEREEAGQSVDDPDLLQQFIAFMKKVLARVTGRDVSIEEIREFVRAGRESRAAQLAQQSGPYRASLSEGSQVPEMPVGSVELITHQSPYPGMTSQKIADYAWPRFYSAWVSNKPDPDAPLTAQEKAKLEAAWRTELADENTMEIAADNAYSEERMAKADFGLYSPTPSQTTPETGARQTRKKSKTPEPTAEDIARRFPRFSLAEQDPTERLLEINEAFSYATQTGQQEGLDPTKATQDQRTFTSDGKPVDFSRASLPEAKREALTAEAIDLLATFSPDGKSKTFGKDLMDYLTGKTPDIYGQKLNDFQQTAILNHLDFAVQERAMMGIDGAEVQRVRSQKGSQAAATLQSFASSIYQPLRDISAKAQELTDKTLKEEGVDPKKLDEEIKAEVKSTQTEIAKDIATPEIKASILQGAENEADDLYELGLSGLDPKFVAMIRERDERIVRIGQLRKLEAMLSSGPKGAKASLAALPDNMTLEEVRAMIAKEEAEVQKLTSNIEAASKKENRKAKEAKAKETEDNATFTAWVMGGESANIDSFDDLMLKYIDPNGFGREQFTTLLTNSFQNADPNLIAGVVNRVADLLDGAATEEGIAADAAKTPNYDARAKRIVATEIAQSSTPEVIQIQKDPFTELTKQRLKGEISAENFQKGLVGIGIEPESAYAYLQKVDQDRARIGDAKAKRELNAQAKKDMAAFRRASEKSDREAQVQIDALAKQFSDTPSLSKAQATSDLKLATNAFLGKEGPPITEEEFLSRLEKLNVTQQKAQSLLRLLQESRRRDSAVRYAKAVQKAQESRQKAIESAVKKLGKTGQGNQTKLRQRSTFVNSLLGLSQGGIMDSETIRQAFAQAYDLHGLTPEVLKDLGERLQQILAMKEGMVKETLLNEFNVVLNQVAPKSSGVTHAHTALMGYILSGMNTMLMQLTGVNRFINPLSNTVEILFSAPGTTAEKLGRTMNPVNFFRLYAQGMREVAENLPQVQAGISGIVSSAGQGVGAMPTSLASVKPREQSLSWTPWGQLSKYRFQTPKVLDQLGLDKFMQATRYPGWMVSRSFQAIRAAEGIIGGADKNMQWRAQMTTALMQKYPKLTWTEAYSRVSDALGDKTTEMWAEAYKQADEEIKAGTVAKLSRKQRATELVQDKIEEQWEADLKNRPREIAALYGYKQDPITPAGAFVYQGLSRFLNQDKGAMQYAKFSFLFARFFANAIETAYTRTPMGGLMALALPTEKSESQMSEREKKIEEIYGSLGAYRDARLARAVSGTAVMGAIAGLMALALKEWDPEDDEAPFFWVTGDPIGEFSKKGTMEAGGWWKANTMYLGPLRINYVNASPEMATVMGAMGAMGDRFLFDKLLNYRENKETGEYERSNYEAYGKPVLEALAAPISRSTYRQWYDAIESAYAGDFKKMTRIVSNPVVGTAVALSPIGLIPSVKSLEKLDRSTEQPRTPRSAAQAVMASVPFASELGLDAGKPLTTPFGNPLTPYPFWSIFSNTQEVPPEVGKAARVLADLGVARLGPKEEYFGWGMAELAHDGKKFLLGDAERARVLASIGTKFARLINQNTAKLRKLEAGPDGRDKVRDALTGFAKQARAEALVAFQRRGR